MLYLDYPEAETQLRAPFFELCCICLFSAPLLYELVQYTECQLVLQYNRITASDNQLAAVPYHLTWAGGILMPVVHFHHLMCECAIS